MSAMLWRVLIAVVSVLLVYALLGPVARVIGFDLSSDVLTIIKVCVGGIALFYIIKGPPIG